MVKSLQQGVKDAGYISSLDGNAEALSVVSTSPLVSGGNDQTQRNILEFFTSGEQTARTNVLCWEG